MPSKVEKPCSKPGCSELTTERFCAEHKQQVSVQQERQRGSAAQRGYDAEWRKARLRFLRKHPLCVECEKEGRVQAATVVDHIIPHKGDEDLFWDSKNNWQSLCKRHHNMKTVREDGGFNRPIIKER